MKRFLFLVICLLLPLCGCSTDIDDPHNDNPIINVIYNPSVYTPTMSSIPGIEINAFCDGADKFLYEADNGKLFTWIDSYISDETSSLELPIDTLVYWGPSLVSDAEIVKEICVTVTALDKDGKVIASMPITIINDDNNYTVIDGDNIQVKYTNN